MPSGKMRKLLLVMDFENIRDLCQQIQRNAIVGGPLSGSRLQSWPSFRHQFLAVFLLVEVCGEEPEMSMSHSKAIAALVNAALAQDDRLLAAGQRMTDGGPLFKGHIAS